METIVEDRISQTRERIGGLKQLLWAGAMRCGLGQAQEVPVIADEVADLELVIDCFKKARQRVDYLHIGQPLWAVAHRLYSELPITKPVQWIRPELLGPLL
jgi:hypothetical protein